MTFAPQDKEATDSRTHCLDIQHLSVYFSSSAPTMPFRDYGSNKVLVFDWDDTICPSTFVDSYQIENINELPLDVSFPSPGVICQGFRLNLLAAQCEASSIEYFLNLRN